MRRRFALASFTAFTAFTSLAARCALLASASAWLGCASDSSPDHDRSLQNLQALEDDLRKDPGDALGVPKKPARRDARAEQALKELLESARARRAAQDEAHAALPTHDDAQLRAFAETYRPANENEAGPLEHYLYGRALLLATQASEARYQYESALRQEPGFSLARAALGLYHFRFEEWAESERYLAQAWLEDHGDPEVAFYLGWTYEKIGKPEKALVLMQEVVGSPRGDEPAAIWLAEYYSTREQPEKVVEILEPVVARHPENDQLRRHLAVAYEEAGRIDDAIAQLEQILPRLKDGWLFYLNQAELLRRADRFEASEQHFQKVLDEAPADFFDKLKDAGGRTWVEQRLRLVQAERKQGRRLFWSRDENLDIVRYHERNGIEARAAAAQRLATERPPESGNALGELVELLAKDPDPKVRIWAPRALQRWAVLEQAQKFLIFFAEKASEAPEVRAACCDALDAGASDAAVDLLLDLLGGEPLLFHAANDALERITGLIGIATDGSYLDDKPDSRKKIQKEWREKVARWRARR